MMEYLFVYGTLRTTEGHPMHNYLRGFCDYLGNATIGGIIIDLGDYTALQLSGNPDDRVKGKLFSIHEGASDELFEVLDRYEGCSEEDEEPHEYFRARQDVILSSDGTEYSAWVYIYNK